MSIVQKTAAAVYLYVFSVIVSADTLAYVDQPSISSVMDSDGSEICDTARLNRDDKMRNDPSIANEFPLHLHKPSSCFTPDENLLFIANIEAQKALGPNAPWYTELKEEVRGRVKKACDVLGYKNSEVSRAYDHCLESRYEELISPHVDKYERETDNYLNKRQQIANSLMVRCDASLSVKRHRLPKEMRFPVAWYNADSRSVPEWLMEEKLEGDEWLENLHKMKLDDIMAEVMGKDCPGEMIYWVTYQ
ncbi:hypothetical protein [uncultured Endozoicomonas sp.]|uniref:hypothetical protein n=1 Tax=uncultured Endozoicomonas sp. TaxID=432652 RepID=UPI0026303731|nr:hypothetical protein [uncultured Endozoicomonas sp.]